MALAIMVSSSAVAATAQPRALGARIGNGAEISYQHSMDANFLQIDGGLGVFGDNTMSIGATGVYNFMISEFGDGFGFYAGPGASIGLGVGEANYLNLGVAGMVGIEYNFDFPLQLSLDFRQHIGIGNGFWCPSSVGLGVRYRF